jgi:hypothetical protein
MTSIIISTNTKFYVMVRGNWRDLAGIYINFNFKMKCLLFNAYLIFYSSTITKITDIYNILFYMIIQKRK